jgi:hypothetical protein
VRPIEADAELDGHIMTRILFSILLVGLFSPPALAQATASKTDEISGNWIFTVQFPEGTETHRASLQDPAGATCRVGVPGSD